MSKLHLGDVVFILEEKEHEQFKRNGDDLHHTAKISLSDALTGVVVSIKTLDDRDLKFTFNDVIK